MKYKELLTELQNLTTEQLECDAVVYLGWDDEYIQVKDLWFATADNDQLDPEHPILKVS